MDSSQTIFIHNTDIACLACEQTLLEFHQQSLVAGQSMSTTFDCALNLAQLPATVREMRKKDQKSSLSSRFFVTSSKKRGSGGTVVRVANI